MLRSENSMFTRAAAIIAVLLLTGAAAQAQTWQSLFGGVAGAETGRGGVQPLAAGGGFISVGSTPSFGPNSDVYVVQSNLVGGVVWAFAYDFGGMDYGFDIQELAGGGFIITGKTDVNGGVDDLFLLNINAAGAVVWAETFGGVNVEAGRDVIEAANGDIVAVGEAAPALPGNQDGLILRTNPAGVPIWVQTYAPGAAGGAMEDLRGLYEAANGDLIVCGATTSFGFGTQAWIMRTTAAGIPLWSDHVGGMALEEFNSVIELQTPPNVGQIVAVGGTTGPAPQDFYVAKFAAGGAMIAPDVTGGTVLGIEEMYQIREVFAGPNIGDILLVGHINAGPLGGDDGYVVEMLPVWACGAGKRWSMAYGGIGADQLYSGDEDPANCIPGFVLCGQSASANLLPPGDPQQHYVIKTDWAGVSGCNEMRPADRCTQPNNPFFPAPMVVVGQPWGVFQPAFAAPAVIWQNLCFTACPGPVTREGDQPVIGERATDDRPWVVTSATSLNGAAEGVVAGAYDGSGVSMTAGAYPNPVKAGTSFSVRYTLGGGSRVMVTVNDITGRTVFTRSQESTGTGAMTVSTAGWPAGSYLVRVDLGTEIQTQRIVVGE